MGIAQQKFPDIHSVVLPVIHLVLIFEPRLVDSWKFEGEQNSEKDESQTPEEFCQHISGNGIITLDSLCDGEALQWPQQ